LVVEVLAELQTVVVVLEQIQMVLIRQYLALELQLLHLLVVAKAVLQVPLKLDIKVENQEVLEVAVLLMVVNYLQVVQELLDKVMMAEVILIIEPLNILLVVVEVLVVLDKVLHPQQLQAQVVMV
jgi:hypothetical protein